MIDTEDKLVELLATMESPGTREMIGPVLRAALSLAQPEKPPPVASNPELTDTMRFFAERMEIVAANQTE